MRAGRGVTAACCAVLLVHLVGSPAGDASAAPDDPAPRRDLGDGPSGVAAPSAALGGRALRVRRIALRPRASRVGSGTAGDTRGAVLARLGSRRRIPLLAAPRRLVPGGRGVQELADGSRLWIGEIDSPGCAGLRLHFSRFDLPDGATATLLDADDPSESYGPFDTRGPGTAGAWHAPTVFGSRVRVEVRVPAAAAERSLQIAADSVLEIDGDALAGAVRDKKEFRAYCTHIDASCAPSVLDGAGRAVSLTLFAAGGSCSGSLVADTDASDTIPWFLTANHCIGSDAEARSTEFYFDYAAPTCGGNAPSLESVPRVVGATMVATNTVTDVTLVRLLSTPTGSREYLPVNPHEAVLGAGVLAVHHPAGLPMKQSRGTIESFLGSRVSIDWTSGYIEPGTSGSPLLDDGGRVIGVASQGELPWCGETSSALYGRMDQSWSFLEPYLNPDQVPGGPPGPPPPGDPPEFFWGLWNLALLGDGESKVWNARLFPSSREKSNARFRIRVRSQDRPTLRLTGPDRAVHTFVRRGRIALPEEGRWTIEVSVPPGARRRPVRVLVSKNF